METQRVVPNSGKIRDFTKKQIYELGVERKKKHLYSKCGVGESSVSWRRKNMVRTEQNLVSEWTVTC